MALATVPLLSTYVLPLGTDPPLTTATVSQGFNVRTYGASGDGVTDDTGAINSAFTAAAGAPIYFPAGSYVWTGSANLVSGQVIFGDGPGQSIILCRAAALPSFLLPTSALRCHIQDLELRGNSGGGTGVSGIKITGAAGAGSYHLFDNILITNFLSHGIVIDGAWKVSFRDVSSNSNVGSGWIFQKSASPVQNPTHILMENCHSESNGGTGFLVSTPDAIPSILGLQFIGCVSILNAANGFDITNSTDITFMGSYSAAETGGIGLKLTGTVGVVVNGGGFHTLTTGIDATSSTLTIDGLYLNANTTHIAVRTGTRGTSKNCLFNTATNGIATFAGAFNWMDEETTSTWTGVTNRYVDTGNAIGRWGCRLSNTTGQVIATGTGGLETNVTQATVLTWDTESEDIGGLHSTSSNQSRITIPSLGEGKWMFTGGFGFPASAAGTFRQVNIYRTRSGVTQRVACAQQASANIVQIVAVSCKDTAQDGDIYEMYASQDTGGNLTGAVGSGIAHFEAIRL